MAAKESEMKEEGDMFVKWRDACVAESKIEDTQMLKRFEDEESMTCTMDDLYSTTPLDLVKQTLDTPILDFEDMMLRMQSAIVQSHQAQVKAGVDTGKLKDSLKAEFNKEGYNYSDEDISQGLDKKHFSAPYLLDVKKVTTLFWDGTLDDYILEKETEAKQLQCQLLLAMQYPNDEAEMETDGEAEEMCTESTADFTNIEPKSPGSKDKDEDISGPIINKKPNLPQLHPLSSHKKVSLVLSARAGALPNPIKPGPTNAKSIPQMVTPPKNSDPLHLIPQQNRKMTVAVRKNPMHNNIASKVRLRPNVPQKVVMRSVLPTPGSVQGPRVISFESLKERIRSLQPNKPSVPPSTPILPKDVTINAVASPTEAHNLPKPMVNLPSSITVLPAQPERQPRVYSNPKQPTTPIQMIQPKPIISNIVPLARPASARKSPHKSTMYSTNPIPIKPKPVEPTAKFGSIQPVYTVGPNPNLGGNVSAKIPNLNESADDDDVPQIMSTQGAVTTFVSKLNSASSSGEATTPNGEEKYSKSDNAVGGNVAKLDGFWLLGCEICGRAFPLSYDSKYRQHMMIEHSIEREDKESQRRKIFSKRVHKCKQCELIYFKNCDEHHRKCSPLLQSESAFIDVRFSPLQNEVIKCGLCNKIFEARINLRQHLLECHIEIVHPTIIDPKYRCSRCLQAFGDSATLTSHVHSCKNTAASTETSVEIAKELLKCAVCSKTHTKISEVQVCYAEKKLIRCMLCLYTCISRSNFSKHMVNCHRRNIVGIACPFCPNSEIAPVRAQFEHIVSSHYSPALEEEDKKMKERKEAVPQVILPTTRIIRLPPGQTAAQYLQSMPPGSALLNPRSQIRTVYRKDASGNYVLSSRNAVANATMVRPVGVGVAGMRPIVFAQNAGGIRYIVSPGSTFVNNVVRPLRPIAPATSSPVGTTTTAATAATASALLKSAVTAARTSQVISVPLSSPPNIAAVNTATVNINSNSPTATPSTEKTNAEPMAPQTPASNKKNDTNDAILEY